MHGLFAAARLAFRFQRLEILILAVAVVIASAVMLWIGLSLDAMRTASPECLAGVGGMAFRTTAPSPACEMIVSAYFNAAGTASAVLHVPWGAPFAMGVILGVPVVAREMEGGTAQLAWSLSRSRVAWLLRRAAFVALFGLALLAVLAVASELLAAAILPERTLSEDFSWFGRRGLPVLARGVGAIMIGILVGALIGRVLPAVLVSGVVIGLAFTGVSLGHDQWNRAEATLQPRDLSAAEPAEAEMTGLAVARGIETTGGAFMSYDEAYGRWPNLMGEGEVYESEAELAAGQSIGHHASLMIAGERYAELMLRDSAVAVVFGAVVLGMAAVVVRRRRPA